MHFTTEPRNREANRCATIESTRALEPPHVIHIWVYAVAFPTPAPPPPPCPYSFRVVKVKVGARWWSTRVVATTRCNYFHTALLPQREKPCHCARRELSKCIEMTALCCGTRTCVGSSLVSKCAYRIGSVWAKVKNLYHSPWTEVLCTSLCQCALWAPAWCVKAPPHHHTLL